MTKTILYISITLFGLFLNKNDREVKIIDGVYILDHWSLINPKMKLYKNAFWIYDYGHAGRTYIGHGRYILNPKDSLIIFKYISAEGTYFNPKYSFTKKEKVRIDSLGIVYITGYIMDTLSSKNNYDSLFNKCLSYTRSTRSILKSRKIKMNKVTRKELMNN